VKPLVLLLLVVADVVASIVFLIRPSAQASPGATIIVNSTVDADGVALAAIQRLYQLSQEQATRIQGFGRRRTVRYSNGLMPWRCG
jgi:alkylated DNA repair dioxygenase AlkB